MFQSSTQLHHFPASQTTTKNMDEFWKNITSFPNIISLPNTPLPNQPNIIIHQNPTPNTTFRGMIPISTVDHHHLNHNQGPEIPITNEFQQQLFVPENQSAFPAFGTRGSSPSSVLVSNGGGGRGRGAVTRKSPSERTAENANEDRRLKKMIKNRESASFARVRNRDYIKGLEIKVIKLTEVNRRLKEQQSEFLAASCTHLPEKHSLTRTRSAPV